MAEGLRQGQVSFGQRSAGDEHPVQAALGPSPRSRGEFEGGRNTVVIILKDLFFKPRPNHSKSRTDG